MVTFKSEPAADPARPSPGSAGWPAPTGGENNSSLPPIPKPKFPTVDSATDIAGGKSSPCVSRSASSSLAAGKTLSLRGCDTNQLLGGQGITGSGVHFVDAYLDVEKAASIIPDVENNAYYDIYQPETVFDASLEKNKFFLDEGWYLLNPENKIYNLWLQLTVILTYWNLFQVPFMVAFVPERTGAMDVLVWLVDMLFIVDMVVIFSTPLFIHGQQVTDRRFIARQYLKLHFWIDLCASVPFDRVGQALFPVNPYVPLLAFTRVLRVRRLTRLLSKMEKNININYESVVLLKLMTLVLVLAHMEACIFWYIGMVQSNGWMDEQGIVEDRGNLMIWPKYLAALYWAVTTYTTVGYGDLNPVNTAEKAYAIVVMLINMALTAYVLGNITMLTTKVDQAVLEYRASVKQVRKYMARKNVSPQMQEVVIQQLETKQAMAEETDQALQHCAPHIRNRILSSLYTEKLSGTQLLMGTSADFINSIAQASSTEFFQPETVILNPKERSLNLYFVLSGALASYDEDGKKLRAIGPGGTFGELSTFCDFPQYFQVKTKSLVKVLAVHGDHLRAICDQFKADHRVTCANISHKIEKFKIHHDRERAGVKEVLARIKLHITTLKTDMVTKLCYTATNGDITTLKALLRSDMDHNINEGDYDGRRPIHVAASSGSVKMVEYLVETEGADPNVVDNFGGTPLHDAVKNGHSATAQMLRNLGGELLLQDAGCKMCNLVIGGNLDLVKLYLESGADPNCVDYGMRTPLHVAAAEGMLSMFKLLVLFGADINSKDRFGVSPVDEARANQKEASTIMSFLEEVSSENADGGRDLNQGKLRNNLIRRGSLNISMPRLPSTH